MREKRDPIEHLGQKLIARGIATEDELKAIDKEIAQVVNTRRRIRDRKPGTRAVRTLSPTCWPDVHPEFSCPRCRPPWRRASSPNGSSRKATRSNPATSSPRSKPTRRRWNSRRSTKARIGKILVPEGTEGVKVNRPSPSCSAMAKRAKASAARGRRRSRRGKRQHAAAKEQPSAAKPARSSVEVESSWQVMPEPDVPAGTEFVDHDGARSLARRHGRRNAPRRDGVPDGRGSRAISGRLQGQPGTAGGVRRASASSTRRSPNTALRASASARRSTGSSPSSNS